MKHPTKIRHLSTLFALVAIPTLHAIDLAAANPFIGNWEGSTQVIVTWCKQKELPVTLNIHADGRVTGKVGDAELTHGQLKKKGSWFGFGKKERTTHIIEGNLEGPIVAAEEITRQKVFIHIKPEDGGLSGSLATDGSKIGGKNRMILTTTSLQLAKIK